MTRLAGESAWNVLPALMLFLTIYSIYHLVKDGKRKDKEKKMNKAHKSAIIFGLFVGWMVAAFAVLSKFVITDSKIFAWSGIFVSLFMVGGLIVALRLFDSTPYKKGSPKDMAFKGCLVMIGVTILIIIYGLFFR